MMTPVFITGNEHKAKQLNDWLGIVIQHQKVDLDEIQSLDLKEVVDHKARQAYNVVRQPVLVEDVAMTFTAFNQLPGPFVKWFEKGSSLETMCHMLDGFDDRNAAAHTMYGLYDGKTLQTFEGIMRGKIAPIPRGSSGFGFDSIFILDGQTLTRAELDDETYARTSYRQEALAKLRQYLQKT
jgi:non-canonical purine NTP pyrophosphatase (RdgB/HAM1 family)